jgi:hypothetical protein
VRYLPELTFELDHGPEEAERLERLLNKLHEEEAARHQAHGHASSQDEE